MFAASPLVSTQFVRDQDPLWGALAQHSFVEEGPEGSLLTTRLFISPQVRDGPGGQRPGRRRVERVQARAVL